MPLTPIDDILVARLKAITARVYHLEVYQKDQGNQQSYPCVVYFRSGFEPLIELAGESGFEINTFTIIVLAENSSDLRKIADAILQTYRYSYLLDIAATYNEVKDWEVSEDDEGLDTAAELQDKGTKYTALKIAVTVDTNVGVEPCP